MIKRLIIAIHIILISVQTAICANPARMFGMFENRKDFEYSYLMPDKISSKADMYLENVPKNRIKLVEMVSYDSKDCEDELRKTVSHTIASNEMDLISSHNYENKSDEFYGVWDDQRSVFTHLLLLKYSGPDRFHLQLMYLVCELSLDDITKLF